ncbi:DDB1- and CUL4-associated factor 8 isoform X1 [Arabidopsis lyrata subsp. lyrata]|uniref:DDB1- and CUL4-associated factor 8 isoform X1 n=1 Tax=Arabidopsis lyrata subsp. lyrata TaxID=81972 RepID=UPI000A29C96D|nr:DDB1- and CUL4-associated factor 8 isoform X1 [Arabidopsis lyrata subsp. lyrata]|eukprot:XP_020874360.1 DDB1- and CUL4-associated factor 8 isoform X1 [Arabidopsis lyrata subsp. lyrata]
MSEKAKKGRLNFNGLHHPVVDFWRREVGGISSRNFSNRFSASENLVLRLEIYKKLEKHKGCVNTVSFNAEGDVLISGSDDRRVVLWDWQLGNVKLSFHSGHANNVFQAKFMPFSDDRTIVTCAADGMVRRASILEGDKVETSFLGLHQGRAHKLCIEPGNPHIFYTCGEDGLVQRFDLRTEAPTELFTCQSVDPRRRNMEAIQLNAIAIDPRNSNLFAVGGMDVYARLYDVRRFQGDGSNGFTRAADHFCPPHLIGNEEVGITGLAFSEQSELLVSYNDEFIYLFTPDMGLGSNPIPSSPISKSSVSKSESASSPKDENEHSVPLVYKGHKNSETVKGVNFFGPRSEYVVSGSDCGRIFIWRKKGGELIRVMEADRHVVNCIEPHPHIPVLASSGIESDIKVWTSKAAERATLPENIELLPSRFRIPWLSFLSFHDYDDELFGNGMDIGIDGNEGEDESIDDAEDDDDSDYSSGLDDNDSDDDMDSDDDVDDMDSDDECFIEIDNNMDNNGGGSETNVDSISGSHQDDDDDDDD